MELLREGDKLRCVKKFVDGIYIEHVSEGKVYTIEAIEEDGDVKLVSNNGLYSFWDYSEIREHFDVIFTNEEKPKLEDKIEELRKNMNEMFDALLEMKKQ